MTVRAVADVVLAADIDAASEAVRRALMNLGASVTVDTGVHFQARVTGGASSVGEIVSIDLQVNREGTDAHIVSRSALRMTVFDFGKSSRNVARLRIDLERGAPLDTGARAFGEPLADPRFRWIGVPLCAVAVAIGMISADSSSQRALAMWVGGVATLLAVAAPALDAVRIRRRGQATEPSVLLTIIVTTVVFWSAFNTLQPAHSPFGLSVSLALSCVVGVFGVEALVTKTLRVGRRVN